MKLNRVVLVLGLAMRLAAQTDTGAISGLITDSSGAIVPGAEVQARNQNTGLDYQTVSNESGQYTLSALPRGPYTVTAGAKGFAKASRADVVVNVQARLEVPFALRPGEVTEIVEVSGQTPLIESQSSSVGQVVENKTIVTLPLNGRNYSQLLLLAPGASPNQGSRASDAVSINGSRIFQNVYLVDGIDNNNYILGADPPSTQAMRPSVDAIQEFKVETANYSAEFGRAAGGVISVSIKSGTNRVHGSAFEFLRNNKLDANNFFSNRAGLGRPPVRRNQFGGVIGGPILKNRTFFFASYQGTMIREPITLTTSVPTDDMARGNFGAVGVFDPLNVVAGNRVRFVNNTIPATRFDAVGRRLAELYPGPNQPGAVNNFVANVPVKSTEHQGDMRFDHRLSAAGAMFVRFSRFDGEDNRAGAFAGPGFGGNAFADFPLIRLPKATSIVFNETHVFSPVLVNEFRAGYTRNDSDQDTPSTSSLFSEFGFRGIPLAPQLRGLPSITVTGLSTLGDRTFTPNPKRTQVRQFIDNVSWAKGNHTIKFGFDMRFSQNQAASSNAARGAFTFNGQFTSETPGRGAGSSLADMLLGQPSSAQLSTYLGGDFRLRYYGYFITDSWKLTRKLTLTLGLRYELQSPPWEHNDNQSNLDLDGRGSTYGKLIRVSGTGIRERTFVGRDTNNLAPRVGFAYQLDPKTVIRGAAGIFYGSLGYLAIGNMLAANVPHFINVVTPTASTAATSLVPLSAGFQPGLLDARNVQNANAVAFLADWPMPEVYQVNFGVQRELPARTVLAVSYVGSGSAFLPGLIDVNDPTPGAGAIQARRPIQGFGAITLNSGYAHSTYHSLQAKVERRFDRGLSLLASYTLSHTLDNSTNGEDFASGAVLPQDPRNTNAEKSNSVLDVRNRFVTSFIYELPVMNSGKLAKALLGGWQVGGIVTLSSGVWQAPLVTPNQANTTSPARPNRIRDGNLSSSERTLDRWFDPSAFPIAAALTFGNSARNVIQMPGLHTFDGLVSRNFSLGESRRLEARAEFFNLTNTAQWGRPMLNVATAQAGRIGNTSVPNRQVQIGLRLVF